MPREHARFRPDPAFDGAMPTLPRDVQAAECRDQEAFKTRPGFTMPYLSPAEEAAFWAQKREDEVQQVRRAERTGISVFDLAAMENAMAAEAMGLATEEEVGASLAASDNVNLPEHYARFKIEPIHFICENGLNFFQGNIVKYVLRHDAKNGLEDLRKARRYLDMFIRFQERDPDWWKVAA